MASRLLSSLPENVGRGGFISEIGNARFYFLTLITARFEPTIQEQCTECASMLKPVYKAGFVVQDQTKSQLVVWVFGEAAVRKTCLVVGLNRIFILFY